MSDNDDNGFFFSLEKGEEAFIGEELKSKVEEESFALSQSRLYLVFDPSSIDSVSVRAYDTTNSDEVTAAHILLQGMLSLLETDFDYLMQLGHEATMEQLHEKSNKSKPKLTVEEVYDNVIKVKFSRDN